MRDDICTIPVSEVFELNDGCPICRMRNTVEARITDYIMGDAMMEPDVRIETNRVGFCEKHLNDMLSHRGRLQLALMLQTHIAEINAGVFKKSFLTSASKRGAAAAEITGNCFICDKIEYGISRMIATIYRCYESERDFREMFNAQQAFCLPHYERLINGIDKRSMRRYGGELAENLTRITGEYAQKLYSQLSEYCTVYDYRSKKEAVTSECKESVERTVSFLSGRF